MLGCTPACILTIESLPSGYMARSSSELCLPGTIRILASLYIIVADYNGGILRVAEENSEIRVP